MYTVCIVVAYKLYCSKATLALFYKSLFCFCFSAICFVAYFCVSAAITLMVSYKELNIASAVASAFHQRGFHFMGYIVGIGATVGLLGMYFIESCMVVQGSM